MAPSLLTLASCAAVSLAAVAEDEVTMMAGWEGPLPSKIYSGYMDSTPPDETPGTMNMHYMFFESEGSPATDPLLIWSNGGPGAGSEFGLFTELGPMAFSDESLRTEAYNKTGIPTPFPNPLAWTKVANILMYDSPPPVGFSYCGTDVGGDGYSCGDWDDTRTAKAAHTFVNHWMAAYPEYANHDLFLSGESYAGVYIPMLAREILKDNSSHVKDNLKGMAIGDGCVGTDVLCGDNDAPWWEVEFFHGHGQVSDKRYYKLIATCGIEQLQTVVTDPACATLLDEMRKAVGGYYSYNLYDECGDENVLAPRPPSSNKKFWSSVPTIDAELHGALNDYPCGGVGAMLKYFNNSEVLKALHIPEGAFFFLTDNGVGFNYSTTEKNLMPFYKHLAEETDVRVLIYNGDTDPGLNTFVGQNWTSSLGLMEQEAWRAWTLDNKRTMGGYVTRYKGDLDFLTIRGSGHMVPEYKPAASLEFITRFLNNEDYKTYNPAP